jgi:hypothetical protein
MRRTSTLATLTLTCLLLAGLFEATRHGGVLTGAATGAADVTRGCSGPEWTGDVDIDTTGIGRAARIRATARQSMVWVGEPLDLEIRVTDRHGGWAEDSAGALEITVAPESTAALDFNGAVELLDGQDSVVVSVVPQQPGTVWFDVKSRDRELTPAFSNPVWIRDRDDATARSLATDRYPYWGDLHVHSRLSGDATSRLTPGETYEAAIDDTDLHFAAITDHDGSLDDGEWREVRQAANDYNCTYPTDNASCYGGRHFVTVLGYEWTSLSPYSLSCGPDDACHGHRNVYLFQDDGGDERYVQNGIGQIPMLSHDVEQYDGPCELWSSYDDLRATVPGLDFMTVPHHVAAYQDRPSRADWDYCPEACGLDASIQPLVEIFSRHGSGEFATADFPRDDPISCRNDDVNAQTVRDALLGRDGCEHRLGFIGSSDAHDGRPGQLPHPDHAVEVCPRVPDGGTLGDWRYPPYRAARPGLVCALVPGTGRDSALTRGGIFQALQSRAVYATTGVRINAWLEMRIGDEAHIMGAEASITAGDNVLALVHADKAVEDLENVELLWLDPGTGQWRVCAQWSEPGASLLDSVDVSENCISSSGTNVYYLKVSEGLYAENLAQVTEDNRWLDVQTADGIVAVELTQGAYSLDEFAAHVEQSLEHALGANAGFSVEYDDAEHRFTIEADTTFDLLWSTGEHGAAGTSAATLLGFNDTADEANEQSYTSDFANLTDGWSARHMAWTSPIWIDVS